MLQGAFAFLLPLVAASKLEIDIESSGASVVFGIPPVASVEASSSKLALKVAPTEGAAPETVCEIDASKTLTCAGDLVLPGSTESVGARLAALEANITESVNARLAALEANMHATMLHNNLINLFTRLRKHNPIKTLLHPDNT